MANKLFFNYGLILLLVLFSFEKKGVNSTVDGTGACTIEHPDRKGERCWRDTNCAKACRDIGYDQGGVCKREGGFLTKSTCHCTVACDGGAQSTTEFEAGRGGGRDPMSDFPPHSRGDPASEFPPHRRGPPTPTSEFEPLPGGGGSMSEFPTHRRGGPPSRTEFPPYETPTDQFGNPSADTLFAPPRARGGQKYPPNAIPYN